MPDDSSTLPSGVLFDIAEAKARTIPTAEQGYVFLCNNLTEQECLRQNVLLKSHNSGQTQLTQILTTMV